ncbi:MAG TPA: hypothetical protein VFG07_09105 [Thermoplasmata archaeon]|nr:hypothetical protein [Thermoplasmata archaeon]
MPEGPASLTPEERRWSHEKFERLAREKNQLASGRTTYYAAMGTVLITGLVVTVSNFLSQPQLLIVVPTFLALLGILISVVWTVLLHRTNDAKNLWREAAVRLEPHQAPVGRGMGGSVDPLIGGDPSRRSLPPVSGPPGPVQSAERDFVDGPGESGCADGSAPHRLRHDLGSRAGRELD